MTNTTAPAVRVSALTAGDRVVVGATAGDRAVLGIRGLVREVARVEVMFPSQPDYAFKIHWVGGGFKLAYGDTRLELEAAR